MSIVGHFPDPSKSFKECVTENQGGGWTFHEDKAEPTQIASLLTRFLGKAEAVPVYKDQEYKQYIQLAERVHQYATARLGAGHEKVVSLNRRVIALKCRVEQFERVEAKGDASQLTELVQRWKEGNAWFGRSRSQGALSEENRSRISETACYPQFVQLIRENAKIRNVFFEWSIRDNNAPAIFIEFPSIQEAISRCRLQGRIGQLARHRFLKITSFKDGERIFKAPTLAFECSRKEESKYFEEVREDNAQDPSFPEDGQPHLVRRNINLLPLIDPDQKQIDLGGKRKFFLGKGPDVVLRNGYQRSLAEVFRQFKNTGRRVGEVELLHPDAASGFLGGVSNYNRWEFASTKKPSLDLEQQDWWNHLPTSEIMSGELLFRRYGLELREDQWVVFARASSKSVNVDVDEAHGYLGVAIPCGDGQWRLLNFGKFPGRFPATRCQTSLFVLGTADAKVVMDDNQYYGERAQASVPFPITESQGKTLMEAIKKQIIKSRKGDLVFQFAADNCANFPVRLLTEANILTKEEARLLYDGSFFEEAEPSDRFLKVMCGIVRYLSPLLREEYLPKNAALRALARIVQAITYIWRAIFINIFLCLLPMPIIGCHLRFRIVNSGSGCCSKKIESVFLSRLIWGGRVPLPALLFKRIENSKRLQELIRKKGGESARGYISYGHGEDGDRLNFLPLSPYSVASSGSQGSETEEDGPPELDDDELLLSPRL